MRLTVASGEPPWAPGQIFEARWHVTLEVVAAEPPWKVGQRFTATLEEPPDKERPRDE